MPENLQAQFNRKNPHIPNFLIKKSPLFFGVLIAVVVMVISIILKLLFRFDVLRFLKDLFMLKYLPALNNNASYGLIFVFGILASFHCVGMCGGIAISQTVKKPGNEINTADTEKAVSLVHSALYNLGRAVSYTIVGAVAGGLGQIVGFAGIWRGLVPLVGGVFMMVMAINLLEIFPFLRYLNLRMPSFIAKKILRGNHYGPLAIGLLTGLMPCGPLQMMQLYALGTKSIVYGAISMFVFSLGTVPLLFFFGAAGTIMNRNYSKAILRAGGALVLVLGVAMVGRGLALTGVAMPSGMNVKDIKTNENIAVIDGDVQTVTSSITSGGFPEIVVQKNIPVRWIIKVDQANYNECNKAFTIPKFKLDKSLVVGENIVEFTPGEPGIIPYTCWMGMIKSHITVVDDLKSVAGAQGQSTAAGSSAVKNSRTAEGTGVNPEDSSSAGAFCPPIVYPAPESNVSNNTGNEQPATPAPANGAEPQKSSGKPQTGSNEAGLNKQASSSEAAKAPDQSKNEGDAADKSDVPAGGTESSESSVQNPKAVTKTVSISGMMCDNCVKLVKDKLSSLDGVKSVEVSLKNKCAVVVLDKEVPDEALKNSVESAGNYKVTGIQTSADSPAN